MPKSTVSTVSTKKAPAVAPKADGPKKVVKKTPRPDEERLGRFSVVLARKKYEHVERKGNEHRRVFSKTALEDITQLSVDYAGFVASVGHQALRVDRNRMFLGLHMFKAVVALPIDGATTTKIIDRATRYIDQSRNKTSDAFHGRHGTKSMTHAHAIMYNAVVGERGGKTAVRVAVEAALVLAAVMDVAVELVVDAAVAFAPNEDVSQSKLVRAVGEVRERTGLFHNMLMEIEVEARGVPERVREADAHNMRLLRSKEAQRKRAKSQREHTEAAVGDAPKKPGVKKIVKKVVKKAPVAADGE